MLTNIQIETIVEGIKNQYAVGEQLSQAIDQIAAQATAANMLAEQNLRLQLENDRMRTKLFSLGITQF